MAAHEQDGSKLEKVLGVVGFFFRLPIIGSMLLLAAIVALAMGAEKAYSYWLNKRREE